MGWNNASQVLTISSEGAVKIGSGYQGDLELALGRTAKSHVQLIKDVDANNNRTHYINKWAFKKSVPINKLTGVTDADIANVHCGLAPVDVDKILRMGYGYSGTRPSISGTPAQQCEICLEEVSEWPYTPPDGSSTQPLRFLDFDGYKANAVAPDAGWTQAELTGSKIDEILSATMTVGGTGYNFALQPKRNGSDYNNVYQTFSMRFGRSSGETIGTPTNMDIPITYITSLYGNWRIALAVWMPYGAYLDTWGWAYFIGKQTFINYYNGQCNIGALLPDWGTNQAALREMKRKITDAGGYWEFPVVPLLVKEMGFANPGSGQDYYTYPVANLTEAYCMPSGTTSFPLLGGTPPAPVYYEWVKTPVSGVVQIYLKNKTSSTHSYKFSYTIEIIHNGVVTSTVTGTTSALAPGETSTQLAGHPAEAGWGDNVAVTAQTQA